MWSMVRASPQHMNTYRQCLLLNLNKKYQVKFFRINWILIKWADYHWRNRGWVDKWLRIKWQFGLSILDKAGPMGCLKVFLKVPRRRVMLALPKTSTVWFTSTWCSMPFPVEGLRLSSSTHHVSSEAKDVTRDQSARTLLISKLSPQIKSSARNQWLFDTQQWNLNFLFADVKLLQMTAEAQLKLCGSSYNRF